MGHAEDKFVVNTKQGALQGTEYISEYNDAKYFAFLGIPYAEPPLGVLRFMPPQPPKPWKGIRNAKRQGKDCLHKLVWDKKAIVGSEDCLYLNVYAPEAPCEIRSRKAVCVIIHSGGNAWGSSSPDYYGAPDFLVHHDVIFVAMNYRLHVFGFLNLNLPQCSGNMGMKDVVMALRWIKENIEFFGGDPNNVTISGNSSSAANVHFLTISPLAKGLFNKAIIQGGYALSPWWSYQENHLQKAVELAKELEFGGNHTKRLLRFLKQLPGDEIVKALEKLRKKLKKATKGRLVNSVFTLSIEAFEEGAFLSRSPRKLLFDAELVPLVWDVCSAEGLHALAGDSWEYSLKDILRENLWMYKINSKTFDLLQNEVQNFYFGDKDIDRNTIPQLVELYSDLWYVEWYDVLNFHATRTDPRPVFLYEFNFRGNLNFVNFFGRKDIVNAPEAACHADETCYFIFHKIFLRLTTMKNVITENDRKVIDNMGRLMTNFMKTGNVNFPQRGEEAIDWKPYHPDSPHYLYFSEELEIKRGLIHEKRTLFWRRMMEMIKKNENSSDEAELETLI